MIFQIGHGGVETGLEEAILLMKVGDRAKLVIPSHLAHGFFGDDERIPPRATLIYDIKIVNLK
jgi:FKBP-type peptidyl-prolyl cis-trans isomerase